MKGNFSSVWALLLTALCSCSSPRKDHPALVRFEYHRPEMGVRFRLVFYADNQAKADAGAEAAYGRIQQLNDILTDYDPESELSRLSRTSGQGREVPLSRDLWFVLKRAQALAERSDGAFDVTVGPYVILWRQARRQHKLPEAARLEQARKSVGYKLVRLNPKWRSAELLAPDMRLDLGGIAKGYALDEAQKVLHRLGIHQALVEGGGDLAVTDPPPGKKGWRVEISPLDVTNAPPRRFALLRNAAISTSGDLYQRLEIDGKRYSHIVDPHTGIGLTDHSLVSVIASDSITADGLTKVVSVSGPEVGLRFIEGTHGAAVRILRNPDDRIEAFESTRFAQYYEKN